MTVSELAILELRDGHPTKGKLQEVLQAANRAADLVNQILTFSRQEEPERKPLSVAPILEKSLKMLRSTLPSTISIRQNISPELGLVLADPTQIQQIVMNLCTNASHAMDETGGILEVGLDQIMYAATASGRHSNPNPRDHIRLTVSDTGCGMSPDVVKYIFDPYFTTKEKGEGTGLGLAVVHGIVTICGGDITVESKVGSGSKFSVYLPVIKKDSEKKLIVDLPPPRGSERILFVEDEPSLQVSGQQILKHLGYVVTTCESSSDALNQFKQYFKEFDVVITDMTMPGMTGDVLARKIIEIEPNIPIILCTGYNKHITEESAKDIGIKAFCPKPFTINNLATAVRQVLDP